MALKRRTTLALLLIVTMVVQPMAFSYAMAGVDHTSHHTLVSQDHSSVSHEHSSVSQEHSSVSQEHSSVAQDHHDRDVLIDCCNSAVCCGAVALDAEMNLHVPNAACYVSPSSSWEGVDLPTEIRPPRNLLV
jgi:hypothetical protein